jgi:hypothetical protein
MEFLQVVAPRTSHHIELYSGKEGLFHDYGLDQEIERIYSPRVELKSGGSLVIEQAEALVAIDVNSGRFRDHSDAETTALKMNQEAAREIARQLRLRDLGGVIVIDFIDMREGKNRAAVERTLRDAIKDDRAKSKVLRMSAFGIVEMTRQRLGPSLRASMYRTCDNCRGTGLIKSEESQALQVMRCLQRAAAHDEVAKIELSVTPAVAHNLANQQRRQLADLESRSGKSVIVMASPDLAGDEMTITCTNSRGSIVAWETNPLEGQGKKVVQTVSFEEMEARRARDKQQAQQPPQAAPAGVPGGAPAGEAEGKAKEPQAKRPAAQPAEPAGPPQAEGIKAKKSRRRGKRGGRKHHKADNASPEAATPEAQPPDKADKPAPQEAPPPRDNAAKAPPEPQPSRDKRPRPAPGRSREPAQAKSQRDKADQKPQPGADEKPQAPTEAGKAEDHAQPAEGDSPDAKDKKKRRRGKRGGRKHKKKGAAKDNG